MKHFKTKFIIIIATIVSLVAITIGVYAYISRISARGEINVSAATINAETTYTSSTNSFDWTYTEAGDIKEINITTNNQTGIILHRYYNIQLASGFTSNENLLKATIVYYNNKYIGTLNDIVNNNNLKIEEEYNFIGLASNKTDGFKFELHQAARNSNLDNKDVKVTITTFTENADYYRYIFVHNEADFKKAIDDMNSGMLSEIPHIVLCNNITLQNNYTISEPTIIYLNGSTLNGGLTINDTTATNPNALLEVLGEGAFNATVTLGANYDHDGAVNLVKNHVKDVLKDGVLAGSTTNILGYYAFYGISVSAITRCTFTSPNIIVQNSSNEYYNALGTVKVNNDENINFKILGSKTELIDGTLAHLPQNGSTISLDLFLPTYIPNQNASITWKSSDESIITNTGKITADRLENAEVTLYAEIRVNETVLTRTFNFKVSAHNNEINFYKLVQEISPIVISNVRNSQADDDDALYHLPIVNENNGLYGTYDYRTSYTSPVNTKLFNWVAYRNIGLESITYSMSQEQQTNFDYITLENSNELYLNNITLNNYASITITGDFGNDETYSTNINISISVGSNTQLLERTFTQISEELSQISILGNILSTRIQSGMANEKGDFSLSVRYLDQETNQLSEDYSVEYSGESNIIPSITYNSVTGKYDFSINPEYFNEYETTVAFTATVYYRKGQSGATSKDRTFYITVPAALHIKDFGTISIYNATKYQVFNQLPAGEKTGTTGYTVSGSSLTDNNLDYILLRDIVGDADYLAQYNHNNTSYLEKINYTSSNYAVGTESLSYLTSSTNPTSTTDTLAYDFARLIEWATGDTRVTASSVVSNTTALGSYASTKANAEDYLNNNEIAVLKQYYQYCTQASDSEWESLFSEVFNVAPGYIYTNPALLNTVITCLSNQITGDNFRNGSDPVSFSTIFGKYMEVIQRYAVSTTQVSTNDVAPCQEIYNTRVVWTHTPTNDTAIGISNNVINLNGTGYTANYSVQLADGTWWQRFPYDGKGGGDGSLAGVYARAAYFSDRTSYITEAELTILRIFLLNSVSQDASTTTYYLSSSFNTSNLNAIESVINANPNYYSNYGRNDFNYIGKAILNAFNACMEIPTYFSTDGVSKIIKSFYDEMEYDVPSYDGTSNTSFVSSLNGNVPYITNGDNIKSLLSDFVNLKTLAFNGNANLAVFLSENGLSTVFARTGLYNTEITSLTMKHVAHNSVNFDLANIKNFKNLTVLDLSNNSGIQSVNELVNVNRSNYTSVNIENIGVEAEYQEFAIDNIASSTCTVNYTNALGENTYSNDSSRASELADLSDFNKFITKYMYMTNVLYDEDGNATTVTWRIDEGNEINSNQISKSGKYPNIGTVSQMNQFVSPYYYCNENFTYTYDSFVYNFVANHIYKIGYTNNQIQVTDLGLSSKTQTTDLIVGTQYLDVTNYTPEISTTTSIEDLGGGTSTTLDSITWFTEAGTLITITLAAQRVWRNWSNYRYIAYDCFTNTPGVPGAAMPDNYTGENASKVRIFFLEYNEVYSILNKKYKSNTTITRNTFELNKDYYLCFVNNNQLYIIGSSQDSIEDDEPISVTTNLNVALKFKLVHSTVRGYTQYYFIQLSENASFRIRRRNNNTLTYHSQEDLKGTFYDCADGTASSFNYTYTPSITIEYSDRSMEKYDVYSAGYEVEKLEGANLHYTDLKRTMDDSKNTSYFYYLYTGEDKVVNGITIKNNTIIAVYSNYSYIEKEIVRDYTTSGSTIYFVNIWYYETASSEKIYIDNPLNIVKVYIDTINSSIEYSTASIKSSYPSDSHTSVSSYTYTYEDETYVYGDDDYNSIAQVYSNLTSTWEYSSTVVLPYASYVTEISSRDYSRLKNQSEFYYGIAEGYNYIFRYNGTTGTERIYDLSFTPRETSYTKNYGYKLVVSNNVLNWELYATSINDQGATSMDSILDEANTHFSDYHYGEYHGKYYAFNGTDRYISSGIYVRNGYIYRIMPNASNTAFEWVEVSKYIYNTSDEILKSLGVGDIQVGDICYSTTKAGFGFFNPGWYKVILDEKTNIVNLVKFNDVGFLTNGSQTYTRLTNDKLVPRSGDYLGYSGTFTVRISAMIRIYNSSTGTWTEYIKTYKLKFVGSLTS